MTQSGTLESDQEMLLRQYVELARRAEWELLNGSPGDQNKFLDEVHKNQAALHASLKYAVQPGKIKIVAALQLIGLSSFHSFFRSDQPYKEVLEIADEIFESDEFKLEIEHSEIKEIRRLRALAYLGVGFLERAGGELGSAREHLEKSATEFETLGEEKLEAYALAWLALTKRDLDTTGSNIEQDIERSLTLFTNLNDERGIALTYYYMAMAKAREARFRIQANVQSRNKRSGGTDNFEAQDEHILASLSALDQAENYLKRSQRIFNQLEDTLFVTHTIVYQGVLENLRAYCYDKQKRESDAANCRESSVRNYIQALTRVSPFPSTSTSWESRWESLWINHMSAQKNDECISAGISNIYKRIIARCLCGLAIIAYKQQDIYRAAYLLGTADKMAEELGANTVIDDIMGYSTTCINLKKKLGIKLKHKLSERWRLELGSAVLYAVHNIIVTSGRVLHSSVESALAEHLQKFLVRASQIEGIQGIGLVLRHEQSILCELSIYALSDFRWMYEQDDSDSDEVKSARKAYSDLEEAYLSLQKAMRISHGYATSGFWTVNTKNKNIVTLLPKLAGSLLGPHAYDIQAEAKKDFGPYIMISEAHLEAVDAY